MASNMTFKANLIPNTNLGFELGSSSKKWKINGVDDPQLGNDNTEYTFASGTNSFTVTPSSNGTVQTVTVTPSIENNITGQGNTGALAKFSSDDTLVTGPVLGNSTTTFLRNDGSWAQPAGTYSLPDATTSTKGGVIIGSGLSVNTGTISVNWNDAPVTSVVGKTGDVALDSITIGNKTYNGSTAVTIEIADLGLASATQFLGITDTQLSDGDTSDSINIVVGPTTGTVSTLVNGDIVMRQDTGDEFIWTGSQWSFMGLASSWALANHIHGNMLNNGTIASDTAAASGQHLVITDNSNAIARSALTFGSDTGTYLRNDGTWGTPDGGVSGVKGDIETDYRTGDVSLSPADIGAVNLTGDTMTGSLYTSGTITTGNDYLVEGVTNTTYGVKMNIPMDTDVTVSGNQWYRGTVLWGADNEPRAYYGAYDLPSTEQGLHLETKRLVDGTAYYNDIRLGIDASGTRTVYLTAGAKPAWRTALDVVCRSGDTMTGSLIFNNDNIGISRVGRSVSWHKGRDSALIKTSTINSYGALASIKTTNGSWDIGAYNNGSYTDDLLFTYVTDTQYNGSSAVSTAQIKFLENGHIVGGLDGTATQAVHAASAGYALHAASAAYAANANTCNEIKTGTTGHLAMYSGATAISSVANLTTDGSSLWATNGSLFIGPRTYWNYGTKTGCSIHTNGSINISASGSGTINYHYAAASATTASISEAASGILRINNVLLVNHNSNVVTYGGASTGTFACYVNGAIGGSEIWGSGPIRSLRNVTAAGNQTFMQVSNQAQQYGQLRFIVGTTTTEGYCDLLLGNNLQYNVAKNATGRIFLYSATGGNTRLLGYQANLGGTVRTCLNLQYVQATQVWGAVWNDYAEMRKTVSNVSAGYCVKEIGDGSMVLTAQRLERGCRIISDTYGFAIGQTDDCQTPIAVSGRVLAYPYESREYMREHIGWPVCSGPSGTVSVMTEEEEMKYSSRIIGTISEVPDYEIWHAGDQKEDPQDIQVNGRIWVYVR